MADENPNRTNIDLNFPPLGNPSDVVEPRLPSSTNGDARKDDLVRQQGGSLFECSICMDLAKDPVVTCCGHLFCWPCLYRWLSHRSSANQCPICKGEVTAKNVTPIYGHDGGGNDNTKVDSGGAKNIPLRPKARRIERARPDFLVGQQGSSDGGLSSVDLTADQLYDMLNNADVSFYSHSDSNSYDSDFWDFSFDSNMFEIDSTAMFL